MPSLQDAPFLPTCLTDPGERSTAQVLLDFNVQVR
jgi:hypothetical protein